MGSPSLIAFTLEMQVSRRTSRRGCFEAHALNGPQLEVTAECFPYGITDPGFRLQVKVQKAE